MTLSLRWSLSTPHRLFILQPLYPRMYGNALLSNRSRSSRSRWIGPDESVPISIFRLIGRDKCIKYLVVVLPGLKIARSGEWNPRQGGPWIIIWCFLYVLEEIRTLPLWGYCMVLLRLFSLTTFMKGTRVILATFSLQKCSGGSIPLYSQNEFTFVVPSILCIRLTMWCLVFIHCF